MKAVVVDKDYGSVTSEELETVKKAYAKAGIDLELQHFTTEDEIIAGCQDAMAILGTGNPPELISKATMLSKIFSYKRVYCIQDFWILLNN